MPWCLPDRNPLFWDDMRRRFLGRGKYRVVRTLVALAAILVVAGFTFFMFLAAMRAPENRGGGGDIWTLLVALQSFSIILFGPMAAVGVISAERERGSLELLFLTPTSTTSLMVQKFLAAALMLSLVLVVYLPTSFAILAMHGVSPLRFLADYLMLAAQIACTVSLGMLASCLVHNTRNATAGAFAVTVLIAYLLYGLLLPLLINFNTVDDRPWHASTDQSLWWIIPDSCFLPILALLALLFLRLCLRLVDRMRNPALYRRQRSRAAGI
jgi:ABC-type transport system involved in multi-copper enzyme maturation permease subunit